MTCIEREQSLHPVRVPINRGLRYLAPSHLFLGRGLGAQAERLQRTLDAMSRDGSLQALQLPSRHVLALHNPGLPPATPLDVARYWF